MVYFCRAGFRWRNGRSRGTIKSWRKSKKIISASTSAVSDPAIRSIRKDCNPTMKGGNLTRQKTEAGRMWTGCREKPLREDKKREVHGALKRFNEETDDTVFLCDGNDLISGSDSYSTPCSTRRQIMWRVHARKTIMIVKHGTSIVVFPRYVTAQRFVRCGKARAQPEQYCSI